MLGWTMLFALMSLGGLVPMLAGHPSLVFKTAGLLFAVLFLTSLLTGAVRRRTDG
jgi:hypothetical protein